MSDLIKRLSYLVVVCSRQPTGEMTRVFAGTLAEAIDTIEKLQAEIDALNLAAWKFTDEWINTEVDWCDEEYEGEMEKLNDLANAVMRLCKPPTAKEN